jgi:hypothetical protein
MHPYRLPFSRVIALGLLAFLPTSVHTLAQKNSRPASPRANARASRSSAPAKTGQTILERNIRAEMNFLASDAMQGRGSDEASKIDFNFMTQSINSLVAPVRWLANSAFRPAWEPGKAPRP